MKEPTYKEAIVVRGGGLPLAAVAVARVISAVGGTAGIIAWLME